MSFFLSDTLQLEKNDIRVLENIQYDNVNLSDISNTLIKDILKENKDYSLDIFNITINCSLFFDNNFSHHLINNKVPDFTYIVYTEDDLNPCIFMDIDRDSYKYKLFSEENNIFVNYPKKNTYIRFENNTYLHSILKYNKEIQPRLVIKVLINDAKTPILKNEIIEFDNNNEIINKNNREYMKNVFFNQDFKYDFDFFDNILYYEQDKSELYKLIDICKCDFDMSNNIIHKVQFKNKNDLIQVSNSKLSEFINNYTTSTNRFNQRFMYSNWLDSTVCDLLIQEAENENQWEDDFLFKNTTQDISVFKLQRAKYLIVKILEKAHKYFKNSYNIPDNVTIDFKDIFIVKYDSKNTHLSMHIDNNFMSLQILLNDDFLGGGTIFEDGIVMKPKKGDLIFHSGKTLHGSIPITQGVRYLLVGFFDIVFK